MRTNWKVTLVVPDSHQLIRSDLIGGEQRVLLGIVMQEERLAAVIAHRGTISLPPSGTLRRRPRCWTGTPIPRTQKSMTFESIGARALPLRAERFALSGNQTERLGR